MRFDRVVILDWSASSVPKWGKDSIWIGEAGGRAAGPVNPGTRALAMADLAGRIRAALAAGERLLIGADFPFGYPAGFAQALTGKLVTGKLVTGQAATGQAVSGQAGALAVWDHLARVIRDDDHNRNNRFAVASAINAGLPGVGPFWGCPAAAETMHLRQRGTERAGFGLPEWRQVETLAKGAQSCWKLFTTGSVGSQALLGIPRLAALRALFPGQVAVWPFEPIGDAPVVLAEVFPSLLAGAVKAAQGYACKDAAQVDLLARALFDASAAGDLAAMLAPDATEATLREEGWILGAGHLGAGVAVRSRTALGGNLMPPRLRNDCFAMPQGVDWVPVDEALARLRAVLVPVTEVEQVPLTGALGRVLAADVRAARANPPLPNSAVDGFGFAHAATGAGVQRLPLVAGRAAAGQPFGGAVPAGHAIRILTGAVLPDGVDTVVLEEDCAFDAATVAFDGPVKPRSNTRRAGEDMATGALALPAGHRCRAPDLALFAAVGVAQVAVRRRLRVAVLSTGDEVVTQDALPHQIYDANRPMLLALVAGWGHCAVDLGHVPDDPALIAAALDAGAAGADVIVTSGGASAGEEDHVSRLLRQGGGLAAWRIAMKPGRPLVLAVHRGVPVFGLPGNPVAALVCALIFARPALAVLAGGGWAAPEGYWLPAGFSKHKKAGRREYLRARIGGDGRVEVFGSEGSGRVSGLAWAGGLVELPDAAVEVAPGDPVRFLPYAGFGV